MSTTFRAPSSATLEPEGGIRSGWSSAAVLAGFVVLCQAAGLLGVPFTERQGWFEQLDKPWFNPPDSVFAPVWTTLYLLMGVAAWLVWRAPATETRRRPALVLFAVQLVLNAAWSPIFFGAQRPGWALVDLGALVVAATLTGLTFRQVDARAGWLWVPYLLWLAFATALNLAIVVMN